MYTQTVHTEWPSNSIQALAENEILPLSCRISMISTVNLVFHGVPDFNSLLTSTRNPV